MGCAMWLWAVGCMPTCKRPRLGLQLSHTLSDAYQNRKALACTFSSTGISCCNPVNIYLNLCPVVDSGT